MTEAVSTKQETLQLPISISIGASAETEVDSIVFVLDSIREKGKTPVSYVLPPEIPQDILDKSRIADSNYRTELDDWITWHFNPDAYKPAISLIQSLWQPVETEYFKVISVIKGLHVPNGVQGDVVLYGVGGGYYPAKNKFSIWTDGNQENPKFKRANPIHTVGHEIIELSLSPLVKALELPHWQKERVIDLLMTQSPLANLFPEYRQQDNGDRKVDTLFSWELAKEDIQLMLRQIKGSDIVQ